MVRKNPLLQHPQFVIVYLEQLLNPQLWLEQGDKLLEASKVLEPRLRDFWNVVLNNAKEGRYDKGDEPPNIPPSDLHGPYFILVSYALENYLKALIIIDRSDEIRNEFIQKGKLPRLINGHNLIKLSREANIQMSIHEEGILIRLCRMSKWKGRYPVPVELSDMQNIVKYSNGRGYFTDYFKPDDIDQLDIIVKRIKDILKGKESYTLS